ncbi:hypothetical protein EDD21DRAFT_374155 [Dissophora ornata]|nr:hypothetical protein EDD21DRAFT_374155 [Dissophora ornata]
MNGTDNTPPPAYPGNTLPPYYAPGMNNEYNRESDPLLGSRDRTRRATNTIAEKARNFKYWMWGVWRPGCILPCLAIVVSLVLILLCISFDSFDSCDIPHDADVTTVIQAIDPIKYQELFFQLERGINGNIAVSQSRDSGERNIIVFVSMQASSPLILPHMRSALGLEDSQSRAKSRIFIDMAPSELDNALRNDCTRVSVNIVFPQNIDEFKTVEIQSTFRGNVHVKLDGVYLTNRLAITANNGNIVIKRAIVKRELDVVAIAGKIQAQAEVGRYVTMRARGDLELVLASSSSILEVKAISTDAFAKVVLTRPFFGHFSISTTSSPPKLYFPNHAPVIQVSDNHTLEGFFSPYGYEPGRLPRVEVKGHTALLEARG